jgi:hypothetical protein
MYIYVSTVYNVRMAYDADAEWLAVVSLFRVSVRRLDDTSAVDQSMYTSFLTCGFLRINSLKSLFGCALWPVLNLLK